MIADWANDTSSWLHILPYLRDNHQLVRYDVRGQGRSEPAANGDYSLDSHRDDLGRVLDGLGLERAHIVAAGLNARIAIAFAHASPDRVRSMALLNPHLAWTRDELAWWDRFLDAYDQVGEPSLGEYTALFIERWFGTVFANREPWVTPFYDLGAERSRRVRCWGAASPASVSADAADPNRWERSPAADRRVARARPRVGVTVRRNRPHRARIDAGFRHYSLRW
ncbi:MAG: alpha/beta fold hydrolase, partial [Gemmatimonadota bacterium]